MRLLSTRFLLQIFILLPVVVMLKQNTQWSMLLAMIDIKSENCYMMNVTIKFIFKFTFMCLSIKCSFTYY